jgi:hypothetical protein
MRRSRVLLALGLACLGLATTALAGSYLDRAGLLVAEAVSGDRFLEKRLNDVELARLSSELAAARLRAAQQTLVPEEVALAHPHLLLMLEHYERAASAASRREVARYYALRRQALDEEQLFHSVLKQLGWTLPTPGKKR